jgi:hypothetical protein
MAVWIQNLDSNGPIFFAFMKFEGITVIRLVLGIVGGRNLDEDTDFGRFVTTLGD